MNTGPVFLQDRIKFQARAQAELEIGMQGRDMAETEVMNRFVNILKNVVQLSCNWRICGPDRVAVPSWENFRSKDLIYWYGLQINGLFKRPAASKPHTAGDPRGNPHNMQG